MPRFKTHDLLKFDEDNLGNTFEWLTRNSMGRHFPGMPIGWYQIHQIAAMDYIQEEAETYGMEPNAVFVNNGVVYQLANQPTFKPCFTIGCWFGHTQFQSCRCLELPTADLRVCLVDKQPAVKLCSTREVFDQADKRSRNGTGSRWYNLAVFDKNNSKREFVLGKHYRVTGPPFKAVARVGHSLTFVFQPRAGDRFIVNPEDRVDPAPYTWEMVS